MGKIISLVNEKGGVGKTTMTFNLAYYLSAIEDKKVLVVDLDPQFNLTRKFWSPNDIPEEIKRKVGTSNALTLFDEPEEFYGKAYLVNERVSIFGTSAHISTC
ncbi:ParA family protein, partial [Vibrio anguillarum]